MAARLARASPDLTVECAEPDVVVTMPGWEFCLACKRPRSLKRIGDKIREGKKQIGKQHRLGVIVIGLDAIFHPPTLRAGPAEIASYETPPHAREWSERLIERAIQEGQSGSEEAFRDDIVGVMYFGGIVFETLRPLEFRTEIKAREVPNTREDAAAKVMAALSRLLTGRSA